MAEKTNQQLIAEAQEHAANVCRDAYAVTPECYRRYITLIKQNKKLGDRLFAPIEMPYMCVDGRVKMATDEHREQGQTLSICNEIENVDGQWMVKTTVVSGLLGGPFIARSPVNIGGRGVDASNPWENSETSALGRALGFMGYGLFGTGLACAEEMQGALTADGNPKGKAYTIPEGKRRLLAGKLIDLGHDDAKIAEILVSITSADLLERAIAKAVQQWEAKAAAAEAAFAGQTEGKPVDIPDDEDWQAESSFQSGHDKSQAAAAAEAKPSPWDPIFATMRRVGISEEDFEAYLLKDYDAQRRGITSARDLQLNAVKRYEQLTATEEEAKKLAEVVRRELAKAKQAAAS